MEYFSSGTCSWLDVALQVLMHAGWRPKCAAPQTMHLERLLPEENLGKRKVVGGGLLGGR